MLDLKLKNIQELISLTKIKVDISHRKWKCITVEKMEINIKIIQFQKSGWDCLETFLI
jgi:hypothetical protein